MIRLLFFILLFKYAFTGFSQFLTYEDVQAEQLVVEGRENSAWSIKQDYVILISIDGFRFDYAEKYGAKNLLKLKEQGVSSVRLLSSFPTKTFPNHYTLVTGLYPGNHGLVSNEFYSREKDRWYRISNKSQVRNASWYGGTPLWTLAEQQGMLSASFFWVGSEAEIGGYLPTYMYPYEHNTPNGYRVRQMIDWLKLPEEVRPHMIFGYFSIVDDAGHRYGPDHEKTKQAVLEVDSLIGQLKQALAAMDLPVHLVLVSDHGMSAISSGIVLPEVVDMGDSKVAYSFPPMIYQEDPGEVERIYEELLKQPNMEVYKGECVPRYLNFQNKDRIGDLVLITSPPTVILDRPKRVYGGTHGFDPFVDVNMGALFIATGPQLRSGLTLPSVENIHVYPFVARLLGLKIPADIDGSGDFLAPAFKQ